VFVAVFGRGLPQLTAPSAHDPLVGRRPRCVCPGSTFKLISSSSIITHARPPWIRRTVPASLTIDGGEDNFESESPGYPLTLAARQVLHTWFYSVARKYYADQALEQRGKKPNEYLQAHAARSASVRARRRPAADEQASAICRPETARAWKPTADSTAPCQARFPDDRPVATRLPDEAAKENCTDGWPTGP